MSEAYNSQPTNHYDSYAGGPGVMPPMEHLPTYDQQARINDANVLLVHPGLGYSEDGLYRLGMMPPADAGAFLDALDLARHRYVADLEASRTAMPPAPADGEPEPDVNEYRKQLERDVNARLTQTANQFDTVLGVTPKDKKKNGIPSLTLRFLQTNDASWNGAATYYPHTSQPEDMGARRALDTLLEHPHEFVDVVKDSKLRQQDLELAKRGDERHAKLDRRMNAYNDMLEDNRQIEDLKIEREGLVNHIENLDELWASDDPKQGNLLERVQHHIQTGVINSTDLNSLANTYSANLSNDHALLYNTKAVKVIVAGIVSRLPYDPAKTPGENTVDGVNASKVLEKLFMELINKRVFDGTYGGILRNNNHIEIRNKHNKSVADAKKAHRKVPKENRQRMQEDIDRANSDFAQDLLDVYDGNERIEEIDDERRKLKYTSVGYLATHRFVSTRFVGGFRPRRLIPPRNSRKPVSGMRYTRKP